MINPNWTPEQKLLYRQTVAILYGNMPLDAPPSTVLKIAKERAAALINDPELFPEN